MSGTALVPSRRHEMLTGAGALERWCTSRRRGTLRDSNATKRFIFNDLMLHRVN